MKKYATALAGAAVLAVSMAGPALAKDKIVGVSWSNFQEERWKTDEAAIKKALEANGDKYISADAQSSASKQLTDVESLISQGATPLSSSHRIWAPSDQLSRRPLPKASQSSDMTA